MRINAERIAALQKLLKQYGLEYSDEEAQQIGLAIVRFVVAKKQRNNQLIDDKGEINDEIEQKN